MAEIVPPSDEAAGAAIRRSLESGRIGTWHWDIASDAVLWDGALCGIYGVRPEEAPRTAPEFLGLVAAEHRDATVRIVSHGLEGAAGIEHRFQVAVGGRTSWIHDRAHVIRDRDARSTSVIGMCCEITAEPPRTIVPTPGPLGGHPPVDLAAYLKKIVESLRRDPQSGAARSLQFEGSPAPCAFDCAVKLGLILLELVAPVGCVPSTARGHRIGVSLNVRSRPAILRIADNRGGQPGAGNRAAAEIGLAGAAALARQIGGTLTADAAGAASYFGTAHSGMLWRLDFPLSGAPN